MPGLAPGVTFFLAQSRKLKNDVQEKPEQIARRKLRALPRPQEILAAACPSQSPGGL
jgi:hypothetical protein